MSTSVDGSLPGDWAYFSEKRLDSGSDPVLGVWTHPACDAIVALQLEDPETMGDAEFDYWPFLAPYSYCCGGGVLGTHSYSSPTSPTPLVFLCWDCRREVDFRGDVSGIHVDPWGERACGTLAGWMSALDPLTAFLEASKLEPLIAESIAAYVAHGEDAYLSQR